MSSHRLARRLRYLTAKYGDHAPYWQFVKWLRSALFILVRSLPQALVDPTSTWRPFAQAIGSLAVLITFGLLHARVRPYAQAFQNRLELVLIVSSAGAVALSCAYPSAQGDDAALVALDAVILLLMLGPLVALLGWWVIKRIKHRLSTKQSLPPSATTTAKDDAERATAA